MPPNYETLTPSLVDEIEKQNRGEQSEWLFLDRSDEFRGCWEVDGLWPEYFIEFEPLIGSYRLVTPAKLDKFLTFAEERGYKPVFYDNPVSILDSYEQWREDPPVSLNSDLEHVSKGFLPWQVVGFNKLVADASLDAGYVVWDTGSGKSALIAAAIKYHQEIGHPFDIALVVVKSHNKIDTQRKLKSLAGIDSIIIDGTMDKRYEFYEAIELDLVKGKQIIAVTNYEKLRDDNEFLRFIFRKRRCLFFWDEMPTKLSNRKTILYRSVKKALYESFHSKPRPSWMRHWILTATPIENSPNDVFSCVNIVWPGLLGNATEFKQTYAGPPHPSSNKPMYWRNLDRLEAKLGFMVHRVSKEDPEVAAMFPQVIPMETIIDWNPKHRRAYDKLTGKAHDLLDEFEDANILAMIQIMQMLCDAPSMVKASAQNRETFYALLEQFGDWDEGGPPMSGPKGSDVALTLLNSIDSKALTDVGHTKLEMWREIICDKHPNDKIVTHSTWAEYIFPVWEHWLQKWRVSYVVFNGTSKQKQTALDNFRTDPDIQVFLSGDAGADSIDIPEARVGVNYNIPWKWTTLKQREGRRDRVNSTFDTIYTYSLVMPDSVDERKQEVCERKHSYHVKLFDGRAQDEAVSASMSREDLMYMLFGSTS